MRSTRISSIVIFCVVLVAQNSMAQQYKLAPLRVDPSKFIAELKAARKANPSLTPKELAAIANTLLDKNGISFAVMFDAATCDRIRKAKDEQKDPKAPLLIGATLKSVDADGASLALPEPIFPSPENCTCYVELPLLQITDADFITVIAGRNIRFHLPSNFQTFDASLLERKDEKIVKRKWRIPYRGSPIGVSHDENVLYLAFGEPELADLSLAVFAEGVFQVATRAEAEDGGKGYLKKISVRPTEDSRVQFDRWGKTMVVSFQPPCAPFMDPRASFELMLPVPSR